MTIDQDTLEECVNCGFLVSPDDAVYKLTIPDGMTREEMRAMGLREAGKRGVRLDAVCRTCRDREVNDGLA